MKYNKLGKSGIEGFRDWIWSMDNCIELVG